MSEFRSPLRGAGISRLDWIDFGSPTSTPEMDALRLSMHRSLIRLTGELPDGLDLQLRTMLDGYSGERGDFFRAFYRPVWSFLRWVPMPEELANLAIDAQAAALFLHLWDDHLCDGQLPIDMLALEFRSLARNRFLDAAGELSRQVGLPEGIARAGWEEYTFSLQSRQPTENFEAYCDEAAHHFAAWTVVPRAAGFCDKGAEDLAEIVRTFSVGWRMLDDLQDIAEDAAVGEKTAVWHLLDDVGRELWVGCLNSDPRRDLEPFVRLSLYFRSSPARPTLLEATHERLASARKLAEKHGWIGLADEIEASASGLR